MHNTVAVVQLSDSFASHWPALAAELGAEANVVGTAAEAARLPRPAAVLLSVGGVEERGVPALAEARAAGLEGLAVVGAAADHRLASSVMRAGAAEYFALPGDREALRGWLEQRLERAVAEARAREMSAARRASYDFSRLIGESEALLRAIDRAARVIPHGTATVLITGETGTGKELLARAIHYNGPRSGAPFVEINCSAIPAALLEAELFGYEAGAFTDARAAKPGLFEVAHGGSLLLDEIGELPPDLQAKLLKVLDDKMIRRLGGLRPSQVDVRVIAATHADLVRAVREGRFRQDLFYRLHVVPIHLPPLRDRGSDVLLLATHFLREFAKSYGLPPVALDARSRAALLQHSWPGNVRELRNALERAVLLGAGSIDAADLFDAGTAVAHPAALPFPATMDEIEHSAAVVMLGRMAGNKSAAAEALGISRSRLYRLLGLQLSPEA